MRKIEIEIEVEIEIEIARIFGAFHQCFASRPCRRLASFPRR